MLGKDGGITNKMAEQGHSNVCQQEEIQNY
jgi:hypothetical protein